MPRQIEYRKLTELTKLPGNPRTIKKKDMDTLKQSVKDNPDYFEARPLILSNRTGELVILAGNQRYEAAKALGMDEVPTMLLEGLTEEREREIIIRDNISNGDWDMDALANEWDEKELEEWGLEIEWAQNEQKEVEEDEAPEVDEGEAESGPGKVYTLGNHKLMCGDSTRPEDVEKLMGGVQADLWLTDPPYNVDYEGGTGLKIQNDKMGDSAFRQFLNESFFAAVNVLKAGAAFYIWHADSEGFNFRGACKDNGLTVRECLIWNKNSLVLGRQDYQWKHEPCLYGWKDGTHNWYNDRKQTTVIDFDRPKRSEEHPTMKPVGLFAYLINNSSKEGDVVLDSFGGSGTTLIACEQLDRKCYTMELDPHYCDVIRKRYWKLKTGSEEGWQEGTK